ncbi:MAG TPA: hypothetical protein VMS73_07390 [Anaerolineaceae bacterium]|nr:hypothetical protein [Anaerolineaceae bacterium]
MSELLPRSPNYAEILQSLLASLDGPIAVDDLATQILELRPSKAKNPRQATLNAIRQEEGRQLVFKDKDHILPLRLAFQGARYRLRLTREQVDRAALSFSECFQSYLPSSFEWENLLFIDKEDTSIPFQITEVPRKLPFTLSEEDEYKEPVVVFKEWFRSQKMYFKDHILVTVVNWEKGVLRLERERFSDQHPVEIARRNQWMADGLYAMLEASSDENIYDFVALPTLYAQLPEKCGIPPDHWMVIVASDSRMTSDGWRIHYADSGFSPLEKMVMEITGEEPQSQTESFTKEEGQLVYRLRAHFAHNPSIWREIEILGREDLSELDSILRRAFQHDTSDHLSGFWKKVARVGGSRKRFREVEIARVNPFEPAEGDDIPIAALKLKVGDQLKYVYDFGDWIEHTLELKSLTEMEKQVKYPRQVDQNKPRYRYCVNCAKKDKQTTATWICLTCSEEKQEEVVLCEKCVYNHEDHYTEKIIY